MEVVERAAVRPVRQVLLAPPALAVAGEVLQEPADLLGLQGLRDSVLLGRPVFLAARVLRVRQDFQVLRVLPVLALPVRQAVPVLLALLVKAPPVARAAAVLPVRKDPQVHLVRQVRRVLHLLEELEQTELQEVQALAVRPV